MSENEEKPPEGGEVVSIEDARKRAEEKAQGEAPATPPPVTTGTAPDPLGNALQPIMAAIARELAGLAGPDGVVKLDSLSEDEQTKQKTQALLRGLGQGLGDALAAALGKWANKVDLKLNFADGEKPSGPTIQSTPIRSEKPPEPPPGADDPTKK